MYKKKMKKKIFAVFKIKKYNMDKNFSFKIKHNLFYVYEDYDQCLVCGKILMNEKQCSCLNNLLLKSN